MGACCCLYIIMANNNGFVYGHGSSGALDFCHWTNLTPCSADEMIQRLDSNFQWWAVFDHGTDSEFVGDSLCLHGFAKDKLYSLAICGSACFLTVVLNVG